MCVYNNEQVGSSFIEYLRILFDEDDIVLKEPNTPVFYQRAVVRFKHV